jgi:SPP1 family holin
MNKIISKIKSLKASTIIRTILQILVYINQLLAVCGTLPFAENIIYKWVSFALTVIITGASYWYNNDWTKFAQVAGDIFDMLKDGKITYDELSNLVLTKDAA